MKNSNSHKHLAALIHVTRVLADLRNRGYKQRFRRDSTSLYCLDPSLIFTAGQFNVDESYHFEELSNPDGDRMLYAISAYNGIKGFLVDTYGIYTDNISLELAGRLAATNKSNGHDHDLV